MSLRSDIDKHTSTAKIARASAEEDAFQSRLTALRQHRESAKTTSRPLFNTALASFKGIQAGTTDRLSTLRENKDATLEANMAPRLDELGQQAGLAQRSTTMEGSLADRRRTDIAGGKALGVQEIEMQEMGNIIQQEGGLQQLDTQFTGIINEMASNAFSNELAGLQEAMNVYMAKEGAALDASALAANARGASMDMFGRFMSAAGMEFNRSSTVGVEGDAFQSAYNYNTGKF